MARQSWTRSWRTPICKGLRRFSLATSDAHGLYARYGFTPPLAPQSLMERYRPGLYTR